MAILTAPAKLYDNGRLAHDGTLDSCLDDWLARTTEKARRTCNIIVDGTAKDDGGHLHWQMTLSDMERMAEHRAQYR